MRSIFSALVQKNGRLQRMPVPGCVNSQEARRQAEKMYDGKVVQITYHGIDYERDEVRPHRALNRRRKPKKVDWEDVLGSCILLAFTMLVLFIIEYWIYILGGLIALVAVILALYFKINRG